MHLSLTYPPYEIIPGLGRYLIFLLMLQLKLDFSLSRDIKPLISFFPFSYLFNAGASAFMAQAAQAP